MGIHIDASEVKKLSVDLARAGGRVGARAAGAFRKTAFDIEGTAKNLAAVDTGNLRGSISTDISGDGRFGMMEAEIGPTAEYGAYVEYGTQPHVIRPTDAEMLAFPGLDGMAFAKVVQHPGTAPQPFMGPAFDRHSGQLEDALGDIGEDIL